MFPAHQLLILGFFIATVGLPCNALLETSYISRFVRECPPGQKLSAVQSTYKWFATKSDRKWVLDCIASPLQVYACFWTDYVNSWDGDVNFNCDNGMIAGMEASGYGLTRADRRFAFKCCETEEQLSNQYSTGNLNELRENFEYNVKDGEYITGVHSVHSNAKEDRQWSFDIKSQ